MSGKYVNKHSGNRKHKRENKGRAGKFLLVAVVILAILIAAVLLTKLSRTDGEEQAATTTTATTGHRAEIGELQNEVPALHNSTIQIENVGSYTGMYMEDGSDEIVSGVLMMVVTNTGNDTVQYAQIELDLGDETAQFSMSTLPAGGSVVLLEQNRLPYDTEFDYSTAEANIFNVAYMREPLNMQEDKLKIQALDGVINITNISGQDITGDIIVYYKNSAVDLFYGGITYRITLTGGLKADEVKQVMAAHFNQEGSKIMFVSIGA